MSTILAEEHRESLETQSSIAAEVIAARGYRTVTEKAELRALGFSASQSQVPALLIPVWGVRGERVLYQLRPDDPRVLRGRIVKYETPSGSRMVLDVNPLARAILANPAIPLWVTEGIKKGDSLVSRGCCAIALLGVWNWRGTNEHSGKRRPWQTGNTSALHGRQVYISFDSDVMLKENVHAALARISEFLKSRGATVAFVYLPPASDGAKQGVDDFFASGKALPDLTALATTELRSFKNPDSNGFVEDASSADRAVAYVMASGVELFHDQYRGPVIAFDNGKKRREIWPLKSKAAASYVRWCFLRQEGKGLTGEALSLRREGLWHQEPNSKVPRQPCGYEWQGNPKAPGTISATGERC